LVAELLRGTCSHFIVLLRRSADWHFQPFQRINFVKLLINFPRSAPEKIPLQSTVIVSCPSVSSVPQHSFGIITFYMTYIPGVKQKHTLFFEFRSQQLRYRITVKSTKPENIINFEVRRIAEISNMKQGFHCPAPDILKVFPPLGVGPGLANAS